MALTQDPTSNDPRSGRVGHHAAGAGSVATAAERVTIRGPGPGLPVENLVRLRPLNAAELLDTAAIVFLSAPLTFVGVALVLISVPRLMLLALETLASRQGAVFDPAGPWATAVRAGVAASIVLGLGLCSIALARTGNDIWFGRRLSIRTALRRGPNLLHAVPVLTVYTLLWLPVFVATVPAWSWPDDWVPPVLLVVWFPVCVLLSIPVSLVPITRVAEGCNIWRALQRSLRLSGIAGWTRMGVAYLLLTFLLGALLIAVTLGAAWITDWFDLLEGTIPALAISAAIDIVALTLIASIVMLVPVAGYADLRIRREGLDVQMLMLTGGRRR